MLICVSIVGCCRSDKDHFFVGTKVKVNLPLFCYLNLQNAVNEDLCVQFAPNITITAIWTGAQSCKSVAPPPCLQLNWLLTVFFAEARDELLGRDHPHFLLLGGDGVEEVSQASEQVLLLLLLGFVRQHVLPERPAEVEGLEHRVTVARVSKLGDRSTWTRMKVSRDTSLYTCLVKTHWKNTSLAFM